MGKALSLWLVLVIIATCIGCGDEGPTDETVTDETAVTFPDSNLEAAIREAIGKPEGPIHTSELEGVSFLAASRRDITDLTGLEYCTNLTHLSLAYNQVIDISPLASLTNLTWLDLAYNQVIDISPLASLINLTMLHLPYNAISDISPLASLTNLTWLHLGMNQVSDISPLARLANLEWLYLQENDISDLLTVTGLANLREIHLSDNNISDISPLVENSGLSKGDTVNLMNNPLGTTSVNVYIPQLEEKRVDVKYFKLHIGVSCFIFTQYQHVSKEVELAAGDSFTITLCSNRTTGFQWSESAQIDDQSVLEQQAHRFVSPEEDTPGAAGKEVWTFKALKEGSTEVFMEYSRPWEGGKEVEWTFRLIVVVK